MKIGIITNCTNKKTDVLKSTQKVAPLNNIQISPQSFGASAKNVGNISRKLRVSVGSLLESIFKGVAAFLKPKAKNLKGIENAASKITDINNKCNIEESMSKLMKEMEQRLDVSYEYPWSPPVVNDGGVNLNATSKNSVIALVPSMTQIKKAQILDEASKIIVESMRKMGKTFHKREFFIPEEANRPTYFYDREATYGCKNVLGMSITTGNEGSKLYAGQWMDVAHLNDSFSQVLSSRLHEMCHKFGGDETKDFSYALTSLMGHLNEIFLKGEDDCNRLRCLSKLWDKAGNQQL